MRFPACISSVWLSLFLFVVNLPAQQTTQRHAETLLANGHAHNDYFHKRPLLDALDSGFCSVEADVFLHDNELKVAHTFLEIKDERTLKSLYLDPLFARVKNNNGSVYQTKSDFVLLVDFKSKPVDSLEKLEEYLAPNSRFLTRLENGKLVPGAVTVVISGNRPTRQIVAAKNRLVFLDGRLGDPTEWSNLISPLISESWNTHFKYRGFREMNSAEKSRLDEIVKQVHQQNKRLRFWALPDRQGGWEVAFESGVDLINTDKLEELRKFLMAKKK